jgi:hypothetical protein
MMVFLLCHTAIGENPTGAKVGIELSVNPVVIKEPLALSSSVGEFDVALPELLADVENSIQIPLRSFSPELIEVKS